MTPEQLRQALNVRTLRVKKAERELRAARDVERRAEAALDAVLTQLRDFDASFSARIAAFHEKAATGLAPESLHSSKAFHSDLASQRKHIEAMLPQVRDAVAIARERAAAARTRWAEASAAARKLQEICDRAEIRAHRMHERRLERDADELTIARSHRFSG